jgi:hypothetical protein
MRAFLALSICILFALPTQAAEEELSFELNIKDHKFTPSQLTIPARKRVKLIVKNLDATPAEFESHDFKAEKVIPGQSEISLKVGPLEPGSYNFVDEFHEDQAKGILIVK